MSDASSFGFGKFIPGFDFLQGLAQSAGSATARPLGRLPEWVAPTVSIEEVDKRITELKAVQFWLDQNGKALAATIQALEVQRMTLSTLQGMNVSMGELAQAFQFPAAATAAATAAAKGAASPGQGDLSDWPMSSGASKANKKEKPQPEPAQAAAAPPAAPEAGEKPAASDAAAPKDESAQAAAVGQAMQWWGALTQQFQQIAAKAMAEPVAPEAVAAAQRATGMAGDIAKAAMDRMTAQAGAFAAQAGKAASSAAKAPAAKTSAKTVAPSPSPAESPKAAAKAPAKAAARKTAPKTTAKAPTASKAPAKSRPPR